MLFWSLSAKICWDKSQLSPKVPPGLVNLHASLFFLSHTGWVETALVMHTAQWNSGKNLLCRIWFTDSVETELCNSLLRQIQLRLRVRIKWYFAETNPSLKLRLKNESPLRLRFFYTHWAEKQQTSWVIAPWWLSVSPWQICITLFWPRSSLKLIAPSYQSERYH